MSDNQKLKLIAIYLIISDIYNSELCFCCERFSNNNAPKFTDIEALTVYIYTMTEEQKFKIKHMYKFANNHLKSWFPDLPSYVAFDNRINRLGEAFRKLCQVIIENNLPEDCSESFSLLDSMPVILCSGKRSGKVAKEITDKGFCSTKGIYYYGLKLHALAFHRPSKLPFPESFVISKASENDLTIFKNYWSHIKNRTFWGDKIYNDEPYFEKLFNDNNSIMLTPVKGVKGTPEIIKQRDKAANDLFSRYVSKIRQPIEGLFNWLIEKSDIQRASRVRSTNGAIVHIFGRIAAAYFSLLF